MKNVLPPTFELIQKNLETLTMNMYYYYKLVYPPSNRRRFGLTDGPTTVGRTDEQTPS